jgi:hypothetical protein
MLNSGGTTLMMPLDPIFGELTMWKLSNVPAFGLAQSAQIGTLQETGAIILFQRPQPM